MVSIDLKEKPVRFTCSSQGSHPQARLDWFWLNRTTEAKVETALDSTKNNNQPFGQADIANGSVSSKNVGKEVESRLTPIANHEARIVWNGNESELIFANGLERRHNKLQLVCRATSEHLEVSKSLAVEDGQQFGLLEAQVVLNVRFKPFIEMAIIKEESKVVSQISAKSRPIEEPELKLECRVNVSNDRLVTSPQKDFLAFGNRRLI